MRIDDYLRHVPTIEQRIRDLQPDALVVGLGPTGWLLPWIDQKLLANVRLWTCHDGCRIMPMDDLVIMDAPKEALHPDTTRYQHIVTARPKRFWVIDWHWSPKVKRAVKGTHDVVIKQVDVWKKHLPAAVHSITTVQKFMVWDPEIHPSRLKAQLERKTPEGESLPDTMAISPTGMTTLAWAQGARRIGVIGVDMMHGHHSSWRRSPQIDFFFWQIAQQAKDKGGIILNLSPITSMRKFSAWNPLSTSGSEPTPGNETQAPNSSSNTPSESTQPAPSTSTGCEPRTEDSRSAATVSQ